MRAVTIRKKHPVRGSNDLVTNDRRDRSMILVIKNTLQVARDKKLTSENFSVNFLIKYNVSPCKI